MINNRKKICILNDIYEIKLFYNFFEKDFILEILHFIKKLFYIGFF